MGDLKSLNHWVHTLHLRLAYVHFVYTLIQQLVFQRCLQRNEFTLERNVATTYIGMSFFFIILLTHFKCKQVNISRS